MDRTEPTKPIKEAEVEFHLSESILRRAEEAARLMGENEHTRKFRVFDFSEIVGVVSKNKDQEGVLFCEVIIVDGVEFYIGFPL